MLPQNAIPSILDVIKNLFGDISPLVWLLLGVSLGLLILDFLFDALFQRQQKNNDNDNN